MVPLGDLIIDDTRSTGTGSTQVVATMLHRSFFIYKNVTVALWRRGGGNNFKKY